MTVLQQILARCASPGPRAPVLLLDLDSTLIDTSHRHLRILREFALAENDPALTAVVDRLVPRDMGYRIEHALIARATWPEDQLRRLRGRWTDAFFSDRYCEADLPTPGAVAFVDAAWRAGAVIYYLSARPVDRMAEGTWRALRAAGFPLYGGRVVLHLKGDPTESDQAFKHGALDEVDRVGRVVATFENEPAHCNAFLARWPEAIHVLLDTVHSPGAPAPDPQIARMPDLLDVGSV